MWCKDTSAGWNGNGEMKWNSRRTRGNGPVPLGVCNQLTLTSFTSALTCSQQQRSN